MDIYSREGRRREKPREGRFVNSKSATQNFHIPDLKNLLSLPSMCIYRAKPIKR